MDVYENCPILETDCFLIRRIEEQDAEDLLEVYSDLNALPFLIVIIVMEVISILQSY